MNVNNPLCSLFILHTTLNEPPEREISLSNKATLNQSDLIWMFFISYDYALLLLLESETDMPLLHFSML